MKMTNLLVVALLTLPIRSAMAEEGHQLLLRALGDTKWELSFQARQEFVDFLGLERAKLLNKVPHLEFPIEFSSLKESFVSYGVATSIEYKNRELSCSFLSKVRANLVNELDRIEFEEITRSGKVCIQRDLKENEISNWSLRLFKFLWLKSWIPTNSESMSLEQYLINRIKIENYVRPDIKILTSIDYDAYGYNFSKQDMKVIENSPRLTKVFEITKNFTPNDPSTFGDLGPEIKRMIEESPATIGGMFITKPTIYVTNNWAPSDMVEILAHEFGHVYHALFKESLLDKGDVVESSGSRVHDEGAAEAVAWFSLCRLYNDFPEIEFFHIFKLTILSQLRKDDPHFVGAASFANQFHYQCPDSSEELHDFLEAKSPIDFMEQIHYHPLTPVGKTDDVEVRLVW